MLKSFPVGCKDILLPFNRVKRSDVDCLTYKCNKERYNDNLCLLRAMCMHKTVKERVAEETKKLFNSYLTANPHLSAQNFRGVGLEDLHIVERLTEVNILVYDIEVSDGGIIGELAGVLCDDSIPQQLSSKLTTLSVMLLMWTRYLYLFDALHPIVFFTKSSNLQRHMPKCGQLVKNIYPKSVHELRGTPFDKLKAFDIKVVEGDTFFNNFAVFDFEPICVKNSIYVDTDTTTWVGKHGPISVYNIKSTRGTYVYLRHWAPFTSLSNPKVCGKPGGKK